MAFLVAAGLLLLLVLAILSWSVVRAPRAERNEDMGGRLEAELADDVAAGVLPAEDFSAAVGDLDTEARHRVQVPHRQRAGLWPWLLIALVAAAGIVVYWQTGNWRAAIEGDRAAVTHRVNGMLAQLQSHLKTHPDDRQGWIALGRAKSEMGDYATAAVAYGHAVKLDHEQNPDLLARWGEARVLSDLDHPDAEERAIFAAVLKQDPDNIRGLWYGGLLALDAGKRKLAVARWQRLIGEKDIPKPMATFVTARLHALGASATAAAPQAATGAPKITLTIGIAPKLAAQVKSGATLFVYVRNPSGGPPLAAKRVPATGFPLQLTLGDGDAMIAGHDLSSMTGKPVEIGAFVSASGKAAPTPDALADSQNLNLHAGGQTANLTLSHSAGKQ
ncbi:MAG: tetratricopeptide repeat protein [Gammaproteobacteria bacterium]